jgi:Cys-rich protein (TIGR01571 family)
MVSMSLGYSSNVPYVEVIAPCDMQGGYTFMARTASGDDVPVTVPDGGVIEGQSFYALQRSTSPSSIISTSWTNLTELTPLTNHRSGWDRSQQGRWKDHIWDCFRFGVFHVSLWNAICCPHLLAAQVATRLRRDWFGESLKEEGEGEGAAQEQNKTFPRVLLIVLLYWIGTTLTAPPTSVVSLLSTDAGVQIEVDAQSLMLEKEGIVEESFWRTLIYQLFSLLFGAYTLVFFARLRNAIRRKHQIPNHICNCRGRNSIIEDAFVSFFCACCSVAQMARQTAEYESNPAACCTRTGIFPNETTTVNHPSPRKVAHTSDTRERRNPNNLPHHSILVV